MARYEVGINSAAAATVAPYAALRAGSSLRIRLRELHISTNAATASQIALFRATNTPVATTSVLGQAQDPADGASSTNADTTWSTVPTVGSIALRRISLPAVAGAGWIWTWPDPGLVIAVGAAGSLVVWNPGGSTASALSLTFVYDE